MVTADPGTPEEGVTSSICGRSMVKGRALLMKQPDRIIAPPLAEPMPTVAVTAVSLQLCTVAVAVPSHTCPVPWAVPKPRPERVTVVTPGVPWLGALLLIAVTCARRR